MSDLFDQPRGGDGPSPQQPGDKLSPLQVVTYTPMGETDSWIVKRWPEFAAEFGAGPAQMPLFHEIAQRQKRSWAIARRLYGIGPVLVSATATPEEMTPQSAERVCAQFTIDLKQLRAELDNLRGGWRGAHAPSRADEGATPEQSSRPDVSGEGAGNGTRGACAPPDLFAAEKLPALFGFADAMFDWGYDYTVQTGKTAFETKRWERTKEENKIERTWFTGRLKEMERMFREERSAPMAREAILNELWLRRHAEIMGRIDPTGGAASDLDKRQHERQELLAQQLAQLDAMFPEMGLLTKNKFKGAVSDLLTAVLAFYGDNDHRLLSHLGTAAEVEVLMRASTQKPEPDYRADLALFWAEAGAGLFDPHWVSVLKPGVLAMARAGMLAGIKAVREEKGVPLPDLEDNWEPEKAVFEEPGLKSETRNPKSETNPKSGFSKGETAYMATALTVAGLVLWTVLSRLC